MKTLTCHRIWQDVDIEMEDLLEEVGDEEYFVYYPDGSTALRKGDQNIDTFTCFLDMLSYALEHDILIKYDDSHSAPFVVSKESMKKVIENGRN